MSTRRSAPTKKFHQRQDEILRVAVDIMNAKGVKGMTLSEVASELEQVPTAVMYYFPSKEALAAACLLRSIETYEGLIAAAAPAATAEEALEQFVRGFFDLRRRIALGESDRIAVFNDVRALGDPTVGRAYTNMFRNARALLLKSSALAALPRHEVNARAHLLLSELFWVVVWIRRYDLEDYPRLADHMLHILRSGLSKGRGAWSPRPLAMPEPPGSEKTSMNRETFLRAATALMNEKGYLGASVQKISERLNVTKGAFYHHLDAKDDLVSACFARTFEVMRLAQREAAKMTRTGEEYLAATASSLLECQLSGRWPLLRSSALTSVPEAICRDLIAEFEKISARFELAITDGIVDGSLRPADATIAAQMLTALTNASVELPWWAPGTTAENVSHVFARPFFEGLLAP